VPLPERWQAECDCGSASRVVLGEHSAAVIGNDVARYRESQTGAARVGGSRRIGAEEALEDVREVSFGDTFSRVADAQLDPAISRAANRHID